MAEATGSSRLSDTTDLLYAVHFSDENHGAAVGFLNGTDPQNNRRWTKLGTADH